MNELRSIQSWLKLEEKAGDNGLSLDINENQISIFLKPGYDIFLTHVNSVDALDAFITGWVLGKTGEIPSQSDSI